ncbi:MAG TPA: DUF3617 family protein [Allosphingosinicella sp.]|nr:DUF3617 family protein [Allosphingosinicella sp.]
MSRSALAFCVALLVPLAAGAAAGSGAFGSLDEFARAVGLKKGGWLTRLKVTATAIEASPEADPAELAAVRARIAKQSGTVEETAQCSDRAVVDTERLPGFLVERGCSYARLYAADGRWALSSSCSRNGNDGQANITSEGTYSRKAVTGRHEGEMSRKGIVIRFKAETESRFTGRCGSANPAVPPALPAVADHPPPVVDYPPPAIILPPNKGL